MREDEANDRREPRERKESETREQYRGRESNTYIYNVRQYYRAIPSEMPRLDLLGMSHCKQWTMRLLLLHNGRSLVRSLATLRGLFLLPLIPPSSPISREHHLRRGYKSNSTSFLAPRARYGVGREIDDEESEEYIADINKTLSPVNFSHRETRSKFTFD